MIAAAYEKDFRVAIDQVKSMNWGRRRRRVGSLRCEQTSKSTVLGTRTDLREIEQDIRSKNPIYGIVDPL